MDGKPTNFKSATWVMVMEKVMASCKKDLALLVNGDSNWIFTFWYEV